MSNTELGPVEHTSRGFEIIHFEDRYENSCSLEQSSIADCAIPGASAVWLGLNYAEPRVLAREAKKIGLDTDQTTGWVDVPLPDEVSIPTRIHLSRDNAIALVAALTRWINTGSFERTEIDDQISEGRN